MDYKMIESYGFIDIEALEGNKVIFQKELHKDEKLEVCWRNGDGLFQPNYTISYLMFNLDGWDDFTFTSSVQEDEIEEVLKALCLIFKERKAVKK